MSDIQDTYCHTCAFTGHRPERLAAPEDQVIFWLEQRIDEAIAEGYTDFISGMQRGVDIWAAEAILKRREENPGLVLITASAFRGMERDWDENWKRRYEHIIDAADEVHYIGDRPGRKAFSERNKWMVDHAYRVIAVYTGAPGGTLHTIEYATKLGREVVAFNHQQEANEGNSTTA